MIARSFRLSLFVSLLGFFSLSAGHCQVGSFTAEPIADAFVATGPNGNLSGDNFGAAGALAIAAPGLPEGEFQSVMKFDLSGAASSFNSMFGAGQWIVQSMTLQLTSSPHNNAIFNVISPGQFNISLMQNNSWVEGTGTGGAPTTDGISFNSLQNTYINGATDQALGTFSFGGGSSGVNSYTLGLTSGIVGDVMNGDEASLRLYAADNMVSYLLSSRMAGSILSPALVIDVSAVPEPRTITIGAIAGIAVLLGYYARRIRI